MSYPNFSFEREARELGAKRIAGLDEAGRGPLAGPVVAGACIFLEEVVLPGLNDSKKLTAEKRQALFEQIQAHPRIEWGIGSATVEEIDRYNILQASFMAMHRALLALKISPDLLFIDGHLSPAFGISVIPIVQGDGKSYSIAAASILAKVTRDQVLIDLDKKFPGYGFAVHKGYATKVHLAALEKLGPCSIHRKSFAPIRSNKLESLL